LVINEENELVKTPEIIDLGHVGEVESVNTKVIDTIKDEFIPIIAPVGIGDDFEPYNINADLVAGAVASALKAEKLILLTDVRGILDKDKHLLSSLDKEKIRIMKKDGTIQGGMIPKVDCALSALENGVNKAHIIDGRIKHSVLLEIFTDTGIGTQITL
jgi:acetylglutamate kinase